MKHTHLQAAELHSLMFVTHLTTEHSLNIYNQLLSVVRNIRRCNTDIWHHHRAEGGELVWEKLNNKDKYIWIISGIIKSDIWKKYNFISSQGKKHKTTRKSLDNIWDHKDFILWEKKSHIYFLNMKEKKLINEKKPIL